MDCSIGYLTMLESQITAAKLGTPQHERYTNFILPKPPCDLDFDGTVRTLSQIFGNQSSPFIIRYQCLKVIKKDEDLITFAGVVSRKCERFKLSSMTENKLKCPISASGLQLPRDAGIKTRMLSGIGQDAEMTMQSFTTDCQCLVNLKHDTVMIGHPRVALCSSAQTFKSTTPKKYGNMPEQAFHKLLAL
ncbi:hypothetical protein T265_15289, partial [Opisthorchis viverrini]